MKKCALSINKYSHKDIIVSVILQYGTARPSNYSVMYITVLEASDQLNTYWSTFLNILQCRLQEYFTIGSKVSTKIVDLLVLITRSGRLFENSYSTFSSHSEQYGVYTWRFGFHLLFLLSVEDPSSPEVSKVQ